MENNKNKKSKKMNDPLFKNNSHLKINIGVCLYPPPSRGAYIYIYIYIVV